MSSSKCSCHVLGASTTPSRAINKPDTIFLICSPILLSISLIALPLGRERREVLRVVGGHGLAAVIDNERRLIHPDFGNAWGDSGIQAQYPARRYTKDHGFAASVLDQCLQVFNLPFPGEGLGVAAVATATPVVIVDREVLAKQFDQLCHTRDKGTIRHRTVDQDDGWTGPNLVESNCSAVFRSYCLHGILLLLS